MIIIVSWACIALVTTGPLSHGGFVNVITIDGLWDDCVIVPVVKGEFWTGLTANFVVLLLPLFSQGESLNL